MENWPVDLESAHGLLAELAQTILSRTMAGRAPAFFPTVWCFDPKYGVKRYSKS
jgi:hypothetical protein